MSDAAEIIKDIRSLITGNVSGVGFYDRWSQQDDAIPYVVVGNVQRVRFNAKEWRSSIYYVTLHLWNRDERGSKETRDLGNEIIIALDNVTLESTGMSAYFTDSIDVNDPDDESLIQIVINLEVR